MCERRGRRSVQDADAARLQDPAVRGALLRPATSLRNASAPQYAHRQCMLCCLLRPALPSSSGPSGRQLPNIPSSHGSNVATAHCQETTGIHALYLGIQSLLTCPALGTAWACECDANESMGNAVINACVVRGCTGWRAPQIPPPAWAVTDLARRRRRAERRDRWRCEEEKREVV